MNFRFASASRPIASCTAALSDQARHQSFQWSIEPVTSSKSVSATPFATKRGPQCAMAEVINGSGIALSSSAFAAAIPRQEARRRLAQREFEQHAGDGEQQD